MIVSLFATVVCPILIERGCMRVCEVLETDDHVCEMRRSRSHLTDRLRKSTYTQVGVETPGCVVRIETSSAPAGQSLQAALPHRECIVAGVFPPYAINGDLRHQSVFTGAGGRISTQPVAPRARNVDPGRAGFALPFGPVSRVAHTVESRVGQIDATRRIGEQKLHSPVCHDKTCQRCVNIGCRRRSTPTPTTSTPTTSTPTTSTPTTSAHGDVYAGRAVVVGIALAADRINARTVVIGSGIRWRIRADRLGTRVPRRQAAHAVRAHFRVITRDRRVRRAIIPQGRGRRRSIALIANRGAQRKQLPGRQRVVIDRGRFNYQIGATGRRRRS